MGKRKRRKNSIDLFVAIFKHLIELHGGREKFALSWLWNDQTALDVFMEIVLGKEKVSKDLLRNGYRDCREDNYEVFDSITWAKIDEVFLKKRLLSHLPSPVRNLFKVLKTTPQNDLLEMLKQNEESMTCNTSYSQTWKEVYPVSTQVLKRMQGKFLGQ